MDPFWAAILGGAVGGVMVAIIDSFLTRSREHERWLREERQRRYTELVDSMERMYTFQDHVMATYRSYLPEPPPDKVFVDLHDELESKRLVAEAALLRLRLVASPRMTDEADELVGRASEVWELVHFTAGPLTLDQLYERQLEYEEIQGFIESARRELRSGRRSLPEVVTQSVRRRWRRRKLRRATTGNDPETPSGPEAGGTSTNLA